MPGGPRKASATACPLRGEQRLSTGAPTSGLRSNGGRGRQQTSDFSVFCSLRSPVLAEMGESLYPQQRSLHSQIFFLLSMRKASASSPAPPQAQSSGPEPRPKSVFVASGYPIFLGLVDPGFKFFAPPPHPCSPYSPNHSHLIHIPRQASHRPITWMDRRLPLLWGT